MNTKEEIEDYINEKFVAGFQNITEVEERSALLMLAESYWHKDDVISGLGIVSATYTELADLVDGDGLVPGQKYLITDFRTIYDRPDFYFDGTPKSVIESHISAVVEPLVLTAISENQFDDRVNSLLYPKDQIRFDYTWNSTEVNGSAAKGRIIERIDEYDNRTDYDHRHIRFLRYDVDGEGNYFSFVPTAFDEEGELFYTFPADTYGVKLGDYSKFYTYYGEPFLLGNNVFIGTYVLNSVFEVGYMKNNTFQDIENVFVYVSYFFSSTILQFFNTMIKAYRFSESTYDTINHCSIKASFLNNNYGNWVTYDKIEYCTFDDQCSDGVGFDVTGVVFTGGVLTFGPSFKYNLIKSNISFENFSGATHVLADYNCEIFKRVDGENRLYYINASDAFVITNPIS